MPSQHWLNGLFSPAAVALVGASPEAVRYGGRVFRFLRGFGFDGPIWPVNPKYRSIDGLACYPRLSAVPGIPEHVGIAVGRERVLATLEECAAIGVKFVTVFTAGYAEAGTDEGRAEQERLAAFVRACGMRLLGPNCNGAINFRRRLALAGTAAVLAKPIRPPGRVAVMSQSGGAGAANIVWRAMRAGVDVGFHASTGNEADIDILDLAEFAIEDAATRVVLLFAERIGDGRKLARVAELAAGRGKAILIQKLGRSSAGSRAAISHTGALTGSDRVHDAAFRQLGLIRVEAPQHLHEAAMMFLQDRPVQADGVAGVSSSGGSVVAAADLAERFGVGFPRFGGRTREALAALVPGYINVTNPTDLSPEVLGNEDMFRRVLDVLADDPAIGVLMPILTLVPYRDFEHVHALARAARKPAAIVWTGGCTDAAPTEIDRLEDGVPVYRDIDTALRATSALLAHARFVRRRAARTPCERPPGIDPARARAVVEGHAGRVLPERIAKQVLAAYGIRTTRDVLARDRDAAVRAWRDIGGAAVMKIESPDVAHKTEAGGVRLDVASERDAAAAFDDIVASVRRHHPGARIDGVVVQERVPAGLEMIAGVSTDPTYGPVLAAGLGGILVEVLRDTSLRLPPVSIDDALEMLGELSGSALLGSVRGGAPRDRAALAELLARLSWLAVDLADVVAEIDVNPVVVLESGQGAIAVDALVVRRTG